MSKKGFTLVELLAVLLILSLLTAIAVNVVTKSVRSSKDNLYKTQLKSIEVGAENWVSDHLNDLPDNDSCAYLTLKNLQDYGIIEKDIKDPRTEEIIPNSLKIKITHIGTGNSLTTYKYEAGANISGCYPLVYEPRTFENGEVVYFDVEKGLACTEEEYKESLGTYTRHYIDYVLDPPMESYTDVEDYGNSIHGYNGIDNRDDNQNSCLKFYAFLDTAESTSVRLLLDHNISSKLFWTDTDTKNNFDGPINALTALNNDTKDWKGTLTPKNYSFYYKGVMVYYNDNGEYIPDEEKIINYTIDYSNYKARFLTVNEVTEITNHSSCKYDFSTSCNYVISEQYNWLYDRTEFCDTHSYHLADANIFNSSALFSRAIFNDTHSSMVYLSSLKVSEETGDIRPVIEVSKARLN